MNKVKFVIFEPDDHYGFPDPVISDDVLVPHDPDVIFQMYGSASCSPYNMGDGWNDEDPDENGDFLFYEYGSTELYEVAFLVLGLDSEEIRNAYYNNFNNLRELDADWFIKEISRAGGVCSEIPLNDSEKDALKQALAKRGDIDQETIDAIENVSRVKKRNS